MTHAASRVGVTVTLALLLSGQSYTASELDAAFGKGTLIISASKNACYRFNVWLAVSNKQHSRGLMHVRNMAADAGMLFIYTAPDRRSMWMKNTYIPLDMLFIRDDGTISSLVSQTEPLSLRSISSIEPVTFVLELNAGVTDRLKIVAGNPVVWSQDPGD